MSFGTLLFVLFSMLLLMTLPIWTKTADWTILPTVGIGSLLAAILWLIISGKL